jgi:hypothetical protein
MTDPVDVFQAPPLSGDGTLHREVAVGHVPPYMVLYFIIVYDRVWAVGHVTPVGMDPGRLNALVSPAGYSHRQGGHIDKIEILTCRIYMSRLSVVFQHLVHQPREPTFSTEPLDSSHAS